MTAIKLTIHPGLLPWWGEAFATCDGDGRWHVHQPEPPTADHVRDYLNARYGSGQLMAASVPQLIQQAIDDLDGKILRPPPAGDPCLVRPVPLA